LSDIRRCFSDKWQGLFVRKIWIHFGQVVELVKLGASGNDVRRVLHNGQTAL
jgi:hypothetical protein